MKSTKFLFVITSLLLIVFYACQNDDVLSSVSSQENAGLKSVSVQGTVPAVSSTTLYAGQSINVGSLVLTEVDTNSDGINDALSVTYSLTGGWLLKEVHFWVGTSLSEMPQTKTGNPQIGKFPYSTTSVAGLSSYTATIPFGDINYTTCEVSYVAAAHAVVYLGSRNETAWAAGSQMNVKGSWATYFNFMLIDNNPPFVSGSLSDVTVEGCSVEDAPDAVTSVSELEDLGLTISDTRTPDDELLVTSSDEVDGSCPIVVTRTYTVTDACDNSSTIVQTIYVDDTTPPELSGQGEDMTIQSPSEPVFTNPTATDNCGGEVTITSNDELVTGDNSTVITRTWTATDVCGNSSSVSQAITVLGESVGTGGLGGTGGGGITGNEVEDCTSWQTETAYGGEAAGSGSAWWFYYDGVGVETIWAGQHYNAGTVRLSGGYLYITLTDGWELQDVSEPVKIQGYSVLPASRPAAGPFTTYKGTSLTIPMGTYNFYVIHLDVRKCTSRD